MKVILAKSDLNIKDCYSILVQLRTTLPKEKFLSSVKRQQKSGYKLAFIKDNNEVVAVAGFRISENLAWGKFMYIDDLITNSTSRSKGYGNALMDWLVDYAKHESCKELHLDSGVQRFNAHRFYLRKRMNITAHHFALQLDNLKTS